MNMTKLLYLHDHYMKEFEAEVTKVDGKYVVLDKSCFYPQSGGQVTDFGVIKRDDEEFKVVFVKKIGDDLSHEVDRKGLKVGDKVKSVLDWERRYKLMRVHTAAHIISEVIHKETGALITGNQLDIDKVRIDFSLENFNKDKLLEYINKANEIIDEDLQIEVEFMEREEAMKLPQVSKLAMGLPEYIKEVRIVRIGDFDMQADGGTHVKSTKEIGELEFVKAENKGKNNRRVYFRLKTQLI